MPRSLCLADESQYAHSPVHHAVVTGDADMLRSIVSQLPSLPHPDQVTTEEESIQAEQLADAVSSVMDRRDVPGRETALHLAVRLGNVRLVEKLLAGGVDASLSNERGWSAYEEAICAGKDVMAMVITRYHTSHGWCKLWRRLPRFIGELGRMQDFYMELEFHFESSVFPFVSRVTPSDTYRFWKRGSDLRLDTSLDSFELGIHVQRLERSYLFLGRQRDGDGGKSRMLVLFHKKKKILDLFATGIPTDKQIVDEVYEAAKRGVYRLGLDVTQAELVPHLTWRKHHKMETVGQWRCKLYDMHNVVFSCRSKKVLKPESQGPPEGSDSEEARSSLLTKEEQELLQMALNCDEAAEPTDDKENSSCDNQWNVQLASSCNVQLASSCKTEPDSETPRSSKEKKYVKGLRPSLSLADDFPLKTEEFLPLLDILSSRVKAVRRLRELLTLKFPEGTFPVKMTLPIVPTIKLVITATKFQELRPGEQPSSEEHGGSWFFRRKKNTLPSNADVEADPFHIPEDYKLCASPKELFP